MSKFDYTEAMVATMHNAARGGVTEEVVESLTNDFQYPRRSVTAKLRKLGYEVPHKAKPAPTFTSEETSSFKEFLTANSGNLTAEEIAEKFSNGKFAARQINGKALSLEMQNHIKPAEKKVAVKTYSEAEEKTIVTMVEAGSYIEDIASKLGKEVASVRGKLLSMQLKAPQKNKKDAKADSYEGLAIVAPKLTVAELAEQYGKTERGVKTVLTRRGLSAKDYTPKSKEA